LCVVLVACTSIRSKELPPAKIPTVTSLPSPQALDLGVLGKGPVSNITWSPDGKLLAVESLTGIYLHETRTWGAVKTIPDNEIEDRMLRYLTFSLDGKFLVFIAQGGAFWRYDLQSEEFTPWHGGEGLDHIPALIFSPDGKSFAVHDYVCENKGTEQQTCSYVLELRNNEDGKLLYSLHKPEENIAAFVFSPDGKQVAAASEDNFARVWDTASGELLYAFQHDSDVLDVAYSPDGRVLATASNDATVRFWDSQTGKNLSVLSGFTQGIQRVAFLDEGKKLLVGETFTNRFQEYALNDQFLPADSPDVEMALGKRLDQYSELKTFISPDTRKMAVLLNDTVRIWDLETGKPLLTLPEYHSRIFTWTFSPDSNMLAEADHNIHLWDVPSQKWLALLPINAYEIQDIAFSPNGEHLVVSASGDLTFWDTSTFQKLYGIKTEYGADTLAYSPDGKRLAIAGNGHIQILDTRTGSSQQQFTLLKASYALALNFSADGKQLYYAGSAERLGWDLQSGNTLYSIQTNPNRYGKAAIAPTLGMYWQWDSNHYYFDPNSNPQWNNALHFFDPITGKNLYDFANPGDSQYIPAALSFDGRVLAWRRNEKIELLDAASGQLLTAIDYCNANALSLSPDARILAAQAYLNPIHFWDISSVAQRAKSTIPTTATPAPAIVSAPTSTPTVPSLSIEPLSLPKMEADAIRPGNVARLEMLNELGLGRIHTAVWSPDGKRFALGGYPNVYVFDVNNSQPVVTLPAEGDIVKLAYSPDGQMLAGQISNAAIQVWDVTTGRSLYRTIDIFCRDADMRFTPDGQIFSAQCGQTTYRWNARDGSLLDKKEDQNRPYGSISPDGGLLSERDGSTARLVEPASKKIIQSIEVPEMMPGLSTFSPDGKTLMIWFYEFDIAPSGVYFPGKDHNSVIQLWNIEPHQKPALRASLPTGKWYQQDAQLMMGGGYQMFSFTADSRRLATASGDGNIQVWNVQSGKLLYTLHGGGSVYFSPDGNQIISLGNSVQVWDVMPGRQPVEKWNISGLYEFQHLLTFTGDELVTTDKGTFRFRAMNGEEIAEQPMVVKTPDENMTISAVSPNGKWLAYSAASRLVLGKKGAQEFTWQTLEEFSDNPFPLGTEAVIFSPDSSMLAVNDADRRILLWRLDDLEAGPLELGRELFVSDLIFTPDSSSLLGVPGDSMEERPIYLWSAVTGNLLRTWKVRGDEFAVHPNGTALAVADYQGSEISIFDLNTWQLLQKMEGVKYIRKVVFSPDGSLLVTSGEDGVKFWDASTGELLKVIEGAMFWQLNFSPNGKLLAAVVNDGRLQIWGIR